MTTPPLPASPCVRVRMDFTNTDGTLAGNRFYLSYGGSAPTGGNCATLGSDIAASWLTRMAPYTHEDWALTEVDVLDIATYTGLSGQWTGSNAGTYSGNAVPANCAMNVEFGIARRYRGGKPRIFWPPPGYNSLLDNSHWDSTILGDVNTATAALFTDIAALSIGAFTPLAHVNLSYYAGFKNIANSSGRERAVPQYKDTATLDSITGYFAKAIVGSQKRRRTATTY
jgi:hypothetical protein